MDEFLATMSEAVRNQANKSSRESKHVYMFGDGREDQVQALDGNRCTIR